MALRWTSGDFCQVAKVMIIEGEKFHEIAEAKQLHEVLQYLSAQSELKQARPAKPNFCVRVNTYLLRPRTTQGSVELFGGKTAY